jgi:hypothetical protein
MSDIKDVVSNQIRSMSLINFYNIYAYTIGGSGGIKKRMHNDHTNHSRSIIFVRVKRAKSNYTKGHMQCWADLGILNIATMSRTKL